MSVLKTDTDYPQYKIKMEHFKVDFEPKQFSFDRL